MANRLRRLGCLLGSTAWLVVMLALCLLTGLIVRGELSWARGPSDGDRLYLIQQRDTTGIGYSASRPAAAPGPGLSCVRTAERLLLWRPATRFEQYSSCSCSVAGAGGSQAPAGDCPP
jgi:hypothetical protein